MHLSIGCLVFPRLDQIDFTGPFEVMSRIPEATIHVISKEAGPIRDVKGLILTPEIAIRDAPDLDVLVVSGGLGQQDCMHDEEILSLISHQANSGGLVFSVCTGALLCGAAGILKGRMATSHWASWSLLPYYGATPVKARVVVDANIVTCAGVTAGLDGALLVASLLRGDLAAETIQLDIEYAPFPLFHSGTPEQASPEVIGMYYQGYGAVKTSREQEARRFAEKLGVSIDPSARR
jgi:cyclohexyl-isocyanide hydratase